MNVLGRLRPFFPRFAGNSLEKKCECELEVKYTRLLTREFCLAWIHRQNLQSRQKCVLRFLESHQDNVEELWLHVLEIPDNQAPYKVVHSCQIYALAVESSLNLDLQAGKGACFFE